MGEGEAMIQLKLSVYSCSLEMVEQAVQWYMRKYYTIRGHGQIPRRCSLCGGYEIVTVRHEHETRERRLRCPCAKGQEKR
jgi:hypothetical protein